MYDVFANLLWLWKCFYQHSAAGYKIKSTRVRKAKRQ